MWHIVPRGHLPNPLFPSLPFQVHSCYTPVLPTAIFPPHLFLMPVFPGPSSLSFPYPPPHAHLSPLPGSIQSLPFFISHLPFSRVFAPFLCLAAYAALSREKMAPHEDEEVRSPGCSLIRDGGFPLIPAIPTSPQLRLPTGFWRFHMFLTLPRGSLPLTYWGPTVLCVSSNAMVLLTWWLSTAAFWDTGFQVPAGTCQEATAANCLSSGCRCHS